MNTTLNKLQESGSVLFHGSRHENVELLEPRQAISYGKPDGEPAVCVTDIANVAIFMAIFSGRGWSGFGMRTKPGLGMYVLDSDWQRAQDENWSGFVYVLDKSDFKHYRGLEWRSYEPIKPVQAIKVGLEDLPEDVSPLTREEIEEYGASTQPDYRSPLAPVADDHK